MPTIPNQSFWKLFNLSFGFFGVQIAYALQSANECQHQPYFRHARSRPA